MKIDLSDNMFAHLVSLFSFSEVRPCQYEGVLKQPGESFHSNNCQKQCRCSLQGELLCQPTVCPSGLKLRGIADYSNIILFSKMLSVKDKC